MREGQMIVDGRGGDERIDLGKGVRRHDVNGLEGGREIGMLRKGGEVDDQEDETVFPAVVGQRQGGETGGRQRVSATGGEETEGEQAYGYRSKASRITSRATRVWACTFLSFSAARSCCRKASMRERSEMQSARRGWQPLTLSATPLAKGSCAASVIATLRAQLGVMVARDSVPPRRSWRSGADVTLVSRERQRGPSGRKCRADGTLRAAKGLCLSRVLSVIL